MPGNLFTNYFLTEGIKATAEWRTSISASTAFAAFRDGVRERYGALSSSEGPNEAVTEQELIRPVLELLGWANYLPQQGTTRNEDIPDYLLFTDAASKERAAGRANLDERFRDAIMVEESKRFGLSLDARDRDDGRQSRTPQGQILRYLSTADIESESRIRWGFLTNGGQWRLYDYRARPRATGYFEADLGEMLESGGEDELRLFYLLFRRDSFTPQQGATTSFLEAALAQGRRYEEKVAQDLSSVFEGNFVYNSLPILMRELVSWLNRPSDIHPVIASGIAQFQLVHIHPFLDGNGRTSRLLSTLCLYRAGYDFKRLFTISEYYDRDRMAFYRALQSVRLTDMDMTCWIEFFTIGLATQLTEVKQRGELAIQQDILARRHDLTDRQVLALRHVLESGRVTINEFEHLCPGVQRRTLQRDLRGLIEKGLLLRRGSTNRLEYVLADGIA